jgi:nucleoside diphosphate kinase
MCSLRARFAVASASINQIHGSDSEEVVANEVTFFFPMQHTVAVIKPDAFHTKGLLIFDA